MLIPLDGVIRNDRGGSFQTGQMLFRVLAASYSVVIASPMSVEDTESFMRRHGLLGWSRVHNLPLLDALAYQRVGSHIQFVITPDEEEAKAVFEQGITVLRISGSDFVNPKWRAEKSVWADLLAQEDPRVLYRGE